jgi:hypothetical protein
MAITSQHVTGFAAGLGFSALTFYIYKKTSPKLISFFPNMVSKCHRSWSETLNPCLLKN